MGFCGVLCSGTVCFFCFCFFCEYLGDEECRIQTRGVGLLTVLIVFCCFVLFRVMMYGISL